MKKFVMLAGVAAVSLTMAACQTTSSNDFSALSSISKECRTAYNCMEGQKTVKKHKKHKKEYKANKVSADEGRSEKAEKLFDYSMRK
tara:strand:- start:2080 stop:2340 length:261 start_codon:yes stop_codon:yes gene_type:complete